MSYPIPPDVERAIEERLELGMYDSAEDVLRAALEALEQAEREAVADLEAIGRELAMGLDELRRGEGIPRDDAVERMRGWREEEDTDRP